MNESDIKSFWNEHPCDDLQMEGLAKYKNNYEKFFTVYDDFRYHQEAHILKCLDKIDFKGKHVLEIGLGQGADSEQIIKRGALWSGVDLTQESVNRVKTRLSLRNIPYQELKQGSALELPFDDNSFDIVFSHGVLHHIPDIETAQREINRVLKPNGELVMMLYAKWSLNYLVSISIFRRLGLLVLFLINRDLGGVYSQHLSNAKKSGLWNYLKMDNFIHKNTDGPLNPYSKVYDLSSVEKDFPDFKFLHSYKQFMHAPPLPVKQLHLARLLGWHLWVHMEPT